MRPCAHVCSVHVCVDKTSANQCNEIVPGVLRQLSKLSTAMILRTMYYGQLHVDLSFHPTVYCVCHMSESFQDPGVLPKTAWVFQCPTKKKRRPSQKRGTELGQPDRPVRAARWGGLQRIGCVSSQPVFCKQVLRAVPLPGVLYKYVDISEPWGHLHPWFLACITWVCIKLGRPPGQRPEIDQNSLVRSLSLSL